MVNGSKTNKLDKLIGLICDHDVGEEIMSSLLEMSGDIQYPECCNIAVGIVYHAITALCRGNDYWKDCIRYIKIKHGSVITEDTHVYHWWIKIQDHDYGIILDVTAPQFLEFWDILYSPLKLDENNVIEWIRRVSDRTDRASILAQLIPLSLIPQDSPIYPCYVED